MSQLKFCREARSGRKEAAGVGRLRVVFAILSLPGVSGVQSAAHFAFTAQPFSLVLPGVIDSWGSDSPPRRLDRYA